jgi:hypothetical protein
MKKDQVKPDPSPTNKTVTARYEAVYSFKAGLIKK